jgi:hypothetical protein
MQLNHSSSNPVISPRSWRFTSRFQVTASVTDWVLPAVLCLCEMCAVLLILTLYHLHGTSDLLAFVSSRRGMVCLAASLGFFVSAVFIIHQFHKSWHAGSRRFALAVTINLVTIMTTIGLGELTLRVLAVRTPVGIIVGNTVLLPRSWKDEATDQSRMLQDMYSRPNYLVYDELLGWTVSPNTAGEDGLSFSSSEGIRSPHANMSFANSPADYRIALVGDSMTFSIKLSYEESWGRQLELELGPKFQVLNFGVPGYGIDQAYLRYHRDVRRWKPEIAILAFTTDGLARNLVVCNFLRWPGEAWFPSKPRFVLKDNHLAALNIPVLQAGEIFSKRTIQDLPFIEYDRFYKWAEWERPYWHWFQRSYLFRLVATAYPVRDVQREDTSQAAMEAVGSEIFRSFIHLVRADGAIPMVVFLPSRDELAQYALNPSGYLPWPLKVLPNAGIEQVTDLSPCLSEINASDLFLNDFPGGGHYSAKGNATIAKCLHGVVLDNLSKEKQYGDRDLHLSGARE